MITLGILSTMATAMGSGAVKHVKVLMTATISVLSDSKVCVCVCVCVCACVRAYACVVCAYACVRVCIHVLSMYICCVI